MCDAGRIRKPLYLPLSLAANLELFLKNQIFKIKTYLQKRKDYNPEQILHHKEYNLIFLISQNY